MISWRGEYDYDMSSDLKTVLDIIPRLSSAELAKVRDAIGAANAIGGAKGPVLSNDVTSDDMWVLGAIADCMRDRGIDATSVSLLRKQRAYGAFRDKVPAIVQFLKPAGERIKQRALLTIGIELLYADMAKIGLAVTSRTMMAHAHRIPGCINRAFPGYASQGFLEKIIRGELHVRPKRSHSAVSRSGGKS